jgi:hypothetical protein
MDMNLVRMCAELIKSMEIITDAVRMQLPQELSYLTENYRRKCQNIYVIVFVFSYVRCLACVEVGTRQRFSL